MENKKAFVGKKFDLKLVPNTELKSVTGEQISRNLNSIGLTCSLASPEKCEEFINSIRSKFPKGKFDSMLYIFSSNGCSKEGFSDVAPKWIITDDVSGCRNKLSTLIEEDKYNKLKEHFKNLAPREYPQTKDDRDYSTEEAIKKTFEDILVKMSGMVSGGLDKDSLLNICSSDRLLGMIDPSQDYNKTNDVVLFIASGIDANGNPSAVGVMFFKWTLQIKNYKDKKNKIHDTMFIYEGRTLIYDDEDVLNEHYNYVK